MEKHEENQPWQTFKMPISLQKLINKKPNTKLKLKEFLEFLNEEKEKEELKGDKLDDENYYDDAKYVMLNGQLEQPRSFMCHAFKDLICTKKACKYD